MSGGRAKRRLWGVVAVGLATFALGGANASAADVTPVSTVDLSSSPPTAVNTGPGDQTDPHISGDVVTYNRALDTLPDA